MREYSSHDEEPQRGWRHDTCARPPRKWNADRLHRWAAFGRDTPHSTMGWRSRSLVGIRHGSMVVARCRAPFLSRSTTSRARSRRPSSCWPAARRSVRRRLPLGGWLHRVACRVAVQAKKEATKRQRLESELAAMRMSDATPCRVRNRASLGPARGDRPAAGAASMGLSVVLSDLEGLTYEQAALRPAAPELERSCYRLAKARTRVAGSSEPGAA